MNQFTEPPSSSDLRDALRQTLESQGWQEVILPKLRLRLATVRAQLEDGATTQYEDLRALQVEIRVLREIVDHPEVLFRL